MAPAEGQGQESGYQNLEAFKHSEKASTGARARSFANHDHRWAASTGFVDPIEDSQIHNSMKAMGTSQQCLKASRNHTRGSGTFMTGLWGLSYSSHPRCDQFAE
ncbi:hypothetical protein CFE70_008146 [Pyrenophora teres f. teres 0-1]